LQPYTCIYCHKPLTDETRTRDHIISVWWLKRNVPFEFRRDFCVMNIAPCCSACNTRKGNRNAHEWTELKTLPGRYYLLRKPKNTVTNSIKKILRIFTS
jgi:hypothetical protein